jgi:two-component system nitrate/nitrite response regulator NarL
VQENVGRFVMNTKSDKLHPVTPLGPIEGDGCASYGSANDTATLVIAARHEITGAGIESIVHAAGHRVVTLCSPREEELVRALGHGPDIVVLAEDIMGQGAATTVFRLRTYNSSVRIIFMIGDHDAITASDLRSLDVQGIVLFGARATNLIDCLRTVHQGGTWIDPGLLQKLATSECSSQLTSSLTSRETEIAHLVSRGLHNKEIARKLQVCEGTVKMHLHHIYDKLHLSGRTQLALSVASAVRSEDSSH